MYITQGRQGQLGMWKYLPLPIAFILLMAANYFVTDMLGADVTEIIKQQISAKGKNQFFAENMAPFIFLLAGLFFWVRYVHQQSILSLTTSRKKVDWGRVFFIFTLMGIFIIVSTMIAYYLNPEIYQMNFEPASFFILAIISLLLVPIQTSFEEYFFRGYLMQGLGLAFKNKWIPLLVTSVLFGLMHIANPEVEKIGYIIMFYYIGTGLFLGIITLMDEGLELALGFHAANNLVTVLLITADWTALQTDSIFLDISEPSAGFDVFLPLLIVFPIIFMILSKKYGWSGWKNKLFGNIVP